jgi:hypothetical protein
VQGEVDRLTPGVYLSELPPETFQSHRDNEPSLPELARRQRVDIRTVEAKVLGVHLRSGLSHTWTRPPLVVGHGHSVNFLKVSRPAAPINHRTIRIKRRSPIVARGRAIRDFLDEFVLVPRVVEGAMLLMALLIAFNAASINMDERAREHATMFASAYPWAQCCASRWSRICSSASSQRRRSDNGLVPPPGDHRRRVADTLPDIQRSHGRPRDLRSRCSLAS